jgi:hypothetical protein
VIATQLPQSQRSGTKLFPEQHLTTQLPWQDCAVLLGPFHPSVVSTPWYCRHTRHRRRSSLERKDYPESIYCCSVPLPIKRLRGLLALLYEKIEPILITPSNKSAWHNGFPMAFAGKQHKDSEGFYYSVNLFDPLLGQPIGTGTNPVYDANVQSWLSVRDFAQSRIQSLRECGFRNGGWWPAPYCFEVRVYQQGDNITNGSGRLFCVAFSFAPHFMAYHRQTVSWRGLDPFK